MKDEIKVNKANKSITFINNGIAFSQFGVADEILDLITNLQEENKRLKENNYLLIDYQDMEIRYNEYKQRNEKALEYCKESSLTIKSHFFSDLENILEGEDKDEK